MVMSVVHRSSPPLQGILTTRTSFLSELFSTSPSDGAAHCFHWQGRARW
jgi:hypothetical protein